MAVSVRKPSHVSLELLALEPSYQLCGLAEVGLARPLGSSLVVGAKVFKRGQRSTIVGP